jgi:putative OPT family oligopeptide transporter
MLAGMVISWAMLMPYLTSLRPTLDPVADVVNTVFRSQVRFIGAGTIGVAALWTLLKIIGPIVGGIRSAMAASRARGAGQLLELTERDLPIGVVGGTILASLIPIAALLWSFAQGGPVAEYPVAVIGATLVYVLVIGIVIASVCGYMAGLIGASNSPVSGVGILAVLGAALLLAAFFGRGLDDGGTRALVAYALFVTAIVFSIATISNDNLQDLKTGQLVGATPWKQQFALILGVIFGSLVIAPILDLLNTAFGFQGGPNAGANALPAPQAALISSLAKGVLGGDLGWGLIAVGAGIGVAAIALDAALGRAGKIRLPPLGVGMGIYLPMALTLLIPIGAAIGHWYERQADRSDHPDFMSRMGVLAATGLIVGESLFGVAFAGVIAATGSDAPLALFAEPDESLLLAAALVVFCGGIAILYRRTITSARAARRSA